MTIQAVFLTRFAAPPLHFLDGNDFTARLVVQILQLNGSFPLLGGIRERCEIIQTLMIS